MRSLVVGVGLSLGAVWLAGCPADPTPTDAGRDATVDVPRADATSDAGAPEAGPPTVRFRVPTSGLPDPLEVPFPSDLYRSGPGRTIVDQLTNWRNAGVTRGTNVLRYAYAGLDGFGHTAAAQFLVDGGDPIDVASLPRTGAECMAAGSSVAIVDVDDVADGSPRRLPCVASYVPELQIVMVQTEGAPLLPGRRYAVVLTDRVRTVSGRTLAASPEFAGIREGAPGVRATAAGALYGAALDRATAVLGAGFEAGHVAGLAVYSASTEHRRLRGVRDALARGDFGPAPQLRMDAVGAAPFGAYRFGATAQPGDTATLDQWLGTAERDPATGRDLPGSPGDTGHPGSATAGMPHDAIGAVLHGAFDAPEFRRAWNRTPLPGDGDFAFGADGRVMAQAASAKVPVTVVLPRAAPPAEGYPVVIFAHGTPSNRQFVMTFANELARAGVATVAMDGLYHGVRASGSTDTRTNYPGPYQGPDGFADQTDTSSTTPDITGSFASAPRYRANVWQFQIEWCQLRRLIANPALDLSAAAAQFPAGTALRFDASRIGWLGTSYGAMTGGVVMAIEPEIRAFMLNVGNGDQLQWLGQAPANASLSSVVTLLFGAPSAALVPFTRFHPLMNIAFGAVEPVFGMAFAQDFARRADAPHPDVLMTEVEYDEYVPNRSTETFAAALGIPQVTPAARAIAALAQTPSPVMGNVGGRTRGLVHLGSASHSSNLGRRWDVRSYEFPAALQDDVQPALPALSPPVWVRQPVVTVQAMMVRYFTTAFAGAAVIDASAIPRRIDFDDDGYCDATERAMGTSWIDPAAHPAGAPDCAWTPGF
jgi:dienelactone hydrolase